jgi:hypothetical protein
MGESLARMVTFLGVTYLLQVFKFDKVANEEYTLETNPENEPSVQQPRRYSVQITPRE